jgi:GPH family glycoside/pentoside/hexuronide:cation symporter
LTPENIRIIDQKRGYGYSMRLMSVVLAILMFITFYTTRERVLPLKIKKLIWKQDFRDLLAIDRGGRAYYGVIFLLITPLNKGIVIIYFTHYLHNQLLAASYLVGLMLVSCRCDFND